MARLGQEVRGTCLAPGVAQVFEDHQRLVSDRPVADGRPWRSYKEELWLNVLFWGIIIYKVYIYDVHMM